MHNDIRFHKMHGCGNDFIFIDIDSLDHRYDFSENLIVRLCNRNFGIGADGLILITRNGCDNLKIDIYNSDGSKANICGNALISLGEYLHTNKMCLFKCGLKNKENVICNVTVKTDSGEKTIFFNRLGLKPKLSIKTIGIVSIFIKVLNTSSINLLLLISP